MRVSPHLCFHGRCADAFRAYQRALGGHLHMVAYGDTPMADTVPPARRDWIVHATLELGESRVMGADVPDEPAAGGFLVHVALPDLARARDVFAALADGGRVELALAPTFWSPGFGVVTDRFGVRWEIDCDAASSR